MNEKPRPKPEDHAYTGETIVMPQRRRPSGAPQPALPRPARRPLWPLVRKGLLVALALLVLLLLLLYIQVRSAAARLVVDDVRSNPPVASPLAGGVNLLIIGVDERPDHPEEGVRGDTLILVHLDGPSRWASMLSIPRDSLADVRDLGETKINFAYGHGYANAAAFYGPGTTPQQGGMALAAETVERFLDLPGRGRRVDYVMQINFDGFATIIDALGGITIDVPQLIVDDAYPTPDFGTRRVEFQPGIQRMDGETALIYARTRHADSDFGRAERQQQVVRAIVDEVRWRGALGQVLLLPRLAGSLEGSVTTTLPFGRLDMLAGLGWLASGLNPDEVGRIQISPETVPNYQEIGSDLLWDPEGVREVVGTFLTRPSEADEAATVQVLNGTGRAGLAGSVTGRLEQAGFTVLPADNAPIDNAPKTVIYDQAGKPLTGRRLAELLDAELRQGAPPEGIASAADIVVILGEDAAAE